MIVLAVRFHIKPDCKAEALASMKKVAAATLEESGCTEYRFFADLENDDKVFLFEEWESQDHLAGHFETEHLAAFRADMDRLLIEPPTIRKYEVSAAGAI